MTPQRCLSVPNYRPASAIRRQQRSALFSPAAKPREAIPAGIAAIGNPVSIREEAASRAVLEATLEGD